MYKYEGSVLIKNEEEIEGGVYQFVVTDYPAIYIHIPSQLFSKTLMVTGNNLITDFDYYIISPDEIYLQYNKDNYNCGSIFPISIYDVIFSNIKDDINAQLENINFILYYKDSNGKETSTECYIDIDSNGFLCINVVEFEIYNVVCNSLTYNLSTLQLFVSNIVSDKVVLNDAYIFTTNQKMLEWILNNTNSNNLAYGNTNISNNNTATAGIFGRSKLFGQGYIEFFIKDETLYVKNDSMHNVKVDKAVLSGDTCWLLCDNIFTCVNVDGLDYIYEKHIKSLLVYDYENILVLIDGYADELVINNDTISLSGKIFPLALFHDNITYTVSNNLVLCTLNINNEVFYFYVDIEQQYKLKQKIKYFYFLEKSKIDSEQKLNILLESMLKLEGRYIAYTMFNHVYEIYNIFDYFTKIDYETLDESKKLELLTQHYNILRTRVIENIEENIQFFPRRMQNRDLKYLKQLNYNKAIYTENAIYRASSDIYVLLNKVIKAEKGIESILRLNGNSNDGSMSSIVDTVAMMAVNPILGAGKIINSIFSEDEKSVKKNSHISNILEDVYGTLYQVIYFLPAIYNRFLDNVYSNRLDLYKIFLNIYKLSDTKDELIKVILDKYSRLECFMEQSHYPLNYNLDVSRNKVIDFIQEIVNDGKYLYRDGL